MIINSIVFKVKSQLATKVKGKVYISYDERNIYVNIENSPKDIWCTTIPVLYAKVSEQKLVSIIVKIITAQYKEDILDKYFLN